MASLELGHRSQPITSASSFFKIPINTQKLVPKIQSLSPFPDSIQSTSVFTIIQPFRSTNNLSRYTHVIEDLDPFFVKTISIKAEEQHLNTKEHHRMEETKNGSKMGLLDPCKSRSRLEYFSGVGIDIHI
ncbi:hypothetical protein L2E82_05214 [Cichorium intybus]|uniref:Uncharacterized protein n=1 Tax=Cichorium intybus TaxID=13427 RepID=A0ACB9H6T2_CICIN|nr:hypothetical protein L2E82_05214 [Cichorium intybus]